MKNLILASFLLGTALSSPIAALAQGRLSQEDLISWATAQQVCGAESSVTGAAYAEAGGNQVRVTCAPATGSVPLADATGLTGAGAAVAVGVVFAAIAAGGSGGSTPDTQ